jgi:chromosome segregation ATPase
MESINKFIMRMINQALGLDEIEAELNGGGQDIKDRGTSLTETDTGLQATRDQAKQEEDRNQQSMEQAGANIADSQATREDAQTLLGDLIAHNEALQAEERAGQAYIVDFGSRYQPFFQVQQEMGDPTSESSTETMSLEGGEFDAVAAAEPSFEPEGENESDLV